MNLEWKKRKETLYKAGYRNIIKKEFELPNGQVAEYDCVYNGAVVCILALTPDHNVILAKQFRAGPEQVLLELPGGGVEKDETPQQAAARELLEETGFAGDLQFVGPSLHAAYDTLVRYNFVARNCVKVAEIKNDEYEFTQAQLMELALFRRHLQSGQLTDIGTGYLGLDFLGLL